MAHLSDLFAELDHLLLTKERPSTYIETLKSQGALDFLPQLLSMQGVPQNPLWHPEGDVWVHTMMVVDEAVQERIGDLTFDRTLMWAALCHDLGKPRCTIFEDGRWRSPGHDHAGVTPTRRMLSAMTNDTLLIENVCRLVYDHLAPHFFAKEKASAYRVRQLLHRLSRLPIELLVKLGRADTFGRTTERAKQRMYPEGDWLLEKAALVQRTPPPPPKLLTGRHFLEMGVPAGPALGRLVRKAYEAQCAGMFDDIETGREWAKTHLL